MDPLKPEPQKKDSWKELSSLSLIIVLVIIPFRLFIAQPFIVEGASMEPTFETSDYLIVDEVTYHFENPERGSVLILKYPPNPKKYLIKRIIGLPNEKVVIADGKVTIINTKYPEGFVLNEPYVTFEKSESAQFEVGPDEYFVMGDNRAGSADSRLWGMVPRDNVVGRPLLRVIPFGMFPGDRRDLFQQ